MLVPLYHLQQEIVEASDDAMRKYYDETPKEVQHQCNYSHEGCSQEQAKVLQGPIF
jgi:hypothetical protein